MMIQHQGEAIYFETLLGIRYLLTHYKVEDGQILYLFGYREDENGDRFYTCRTCYELTPDSLVGLRVSA